MPDVSEIKKQLNSRLGEILGRLEDVDADRSHQHSKLDPDFEEQAVQRENDQVLDALDETLREEVLQIRSALGRIDSGSYGVCASCGKEIPEARLQAVPSATQCTNCA